MNKNSQKDKLLKQATELMESPEGTVSDEEPTLDFDKQTRIMVKNGGYHVWTKRAGVGNESDDYYWKQISNFRLDCVSIERFCDKEGLSDTVQRKVRIRTAKGVELVTKIDADQMNTLSVFLKWLYNINVGGRFQGSQSELTNIIGTYVIDAGPRETRIKNISGHEPETGTWIFANAAVFEGAIYPASDQGLINVPASGEIPERNYKLVANDNTGSGKLPRLALDVKVEDPHELVRDYVELLTAAWGPDMEILVGWFLACLFRHRCISDENLQSFPLMLISSPPLSGKSTLMRTMLNMFGMRGYKPPSMQHVTQTSIYTMPNQYCDIPVWVDEFKGGIMVEKPWLLEALKTNWDGGQRTVGTLDTFTTKTRSMRTALVISGETRSTDTALDSRCVDVEVKHTGKRPLWEKANDMSTQMSAVVQDILLRYEDYWSVFRDRIEVVLRSLSSTAKPGVDSRMLLNYAVPCAFLDVYAPDGARVDRFRGSLGSKVVRTDSTNLLGQMLMSLPYMIQMERTPIPYKIDHKKGSLNVLATFFMKAYQNKHRGSEMLRDELVRRGRDSGLLRSDHRGGALVRGMVNSLNQTTGAYESNQQWVFMFDITHPTVADAVEQLEKKKE